MRTSQRTFPSGNSLVSDLPKSTNFDIGALCLDIPESMRKDCSIM